MACSFKLCMDHFYTHLTSTISAMHFLADFPRDDVDCDFAVFVPYTYATTVTLKVLMPIFVSSFV